MKSNLNSANIVTMDPKSIKFLYSYGGKIIPRHSDGQLRYVGGHIRIISVDRFITIADLMAKFEESCGWSVSLKCKLPTEDLDVLVSITSDDDLTNIVDEYIRTSSNQDLKIRVILFPIKSIEKVNPIVSSGSSVDSSGTVSPPMRKAMFGRRGSPLVFGFPVSFQRVIGHVQRYHCCGDGSIVRSNLIHPRWRR